jgi:hypothetical protein
LQAGPGHRGIDTSKLQNVTSACKKYKKVISSSKSAASGF